MLQYSQPDTHMESPPPPAVEGVKLPSVASASRKRRRGDAPPPPTTNYYTTNNITNYFLAAPAPTPPAEVPTSMFATNADRLKRVSVKMKSKWRLVYVWYSTRDGTLKGGCHNTCRKQFHDFSNFAPADGSHITQGARTKFDAAYAAYQVAFAAGDRDECVAQRAILELLRSKFCFGCRPDPGYLPQAARACKDWWNTTRQAMALKNDGCEHPDCPERGPDIWPILTADHGTNPKQRDAEGKPVNLSDYKWWSCHGGVDAMSEEAKQIHQYICRCCHALEPTSKQGNRYPDPKDMPKGKARGTDKQTKQYSARHSAVRVHPKQQYIDALKRLVGQCAACARPVIAGQEVAHEWNHTIEATKSKGGLFGATGGVAGLVHNHSNAAALEFALEAAFEPIEPLYDAWRLARNIGNPTGQVRGLLDGETDKCNLLCSNCHHRHTNNYEPSTTVF